MLCYDNFIEISNYAKKRDLLNLLSTCRAYRSLVIVYHDKYAFKLNQKQHKIQKDLQTLRNVIRKNKRINADQIYYQMVNYSIDNHTEWLKCGNQYNGQFRNLYKINKLIVGNRYNQPLLVSLYSLSGNPFYLNPFLQSNLITLIIGNDFDQEIDHFLPQTLIKLILGNKFNHPVDDLPKKLEIFIVGNSFDQSVDYLPNSLKVLKIGKKFSKSFDELPDGLISLSINSHLGLWSKHNKRLPNSLKYLYLRILYSVEQFPSGLETIECKRCYQPAFLKLPTQLKKIWCHEQFDDSYNLQVKFPNSVKSIKMPNLTHNAILPDNIEELIVTGYIASTPLQLPSSLKILNITSNFNFFPKPIFAYPIQLKSLTIFYLGIPIKDLPVTLEHLTINEYFNQDPITELPISLKILNLRIMNTISYFPQLKKLSVYRDHPQIEELKQMYRRRLKYVNEK